MVQDSGIGIDMENAERLFNAFFHHQSGRRGNRVVDQPRDDRWGHGGNLIVSPNADHGATSQFTLPSSSQGVS